MYHVRDDANLTFIVKLSQILALIHFPLLTSAISGGTMMAIQDTGCLRKQAESKLYCFNPEPDLDNANVGRNQLLLTAVCVLAYCSFFHITTTYKNSSGRQEFYS